MADFNGKVVLVTGASGNVGSAAARLFAEQGAKLALVARDASALASLVDQLKTEVLTEAVDLNDAGAVDGLIARIVERFGRLDILVHTVGGYVAGEPVHQTGVDVLEKAFALNVRPVYITAGRVAAHMVERGGGGKIIVILAKTALKGQANAAAYSASKAAAQRIVESMALELRDHAINVNGILPSIIDTPENRKAMPKADTSKWVTPEDMAQAAAYLASPAAAKITGASLEVFGRV